MPSDIEPTKRTFFNRPHSSLDISDIVKRRGPSTKYHNSSAPRNPLDPSYRLPSEPVRMDAIPKFSHNSIGVEDIAYARPHLRVNTFATRERQLNVSDIRGTKPKKLTQTRNRGFAVNSLDVSDICTPAFRTKRETNPLSPRYAYYQNGPAPALGAKMATAGVPPPPSEPAYYGYIEKGHPKAARAARENDVSLRTDDIDAATVGYRKLQRPPRHFYETNRTDDITGAQADSLKAQMRTKRVVNPLDPEYCLENTWIAHGTEMRDPVPRDRYGQPVNTHFKEKVAKMRAAADEEFNARNEQRVRLSESSKQPEPSSSSLTEPSTQIAQTSSTVPSSQAIEAEQQENVVALSQPQSRHSRAKPTQPSQLPHRRHSSKGSQVGSGDCTAASNEDISRSTLNTAPTPNWDLYKYSENSYSELKAGRPKKAKTPDIMPTNPTNFVDYPMMNNNRSQTGTYHLKHDTSKNTLGLVNAQAFSRTATGRLEDHPYADSEDASLSRSNSVGSPLFKGSSTEKMTYLNATYGGDPAAKPRRRSAAASNKCFAKTSKATGAYESKPLSYYTGRGVVAPTGPSSRLSSNGIMFKTFGAKQRHIARQIDIASVAALQ